MNKTKHPIICEFCDAPAICSGVKFAGYYSCASGPFDLCEKDLKFMTECDGLPFGDYRILDEEGFNKAVWDRNHA